MKHLFKQVLRFLFFALLLLLAVAISYSVSDNFFHTDRGFLAHKQLALQQAYYLPAFYAHISTAALVLVLGALQYWHGLRRFWPLLHRISGRIALFLVVFFAAPGGFLMGLASEPSFSSPLCFGLLSCLWFWHSLQAYRTARAGNFLEHERQASLSYSLACSAPFLRIYSFIGSYFFALAGLKVYAVLVWLSWLPQYAFVYMYYSRRS